jgi:hypothetical protein
VAEVAGHRVIELRARCLHSILTSGVPRRLRPGFWDNDGRCCGTAGVGDVLLDAAQDSADAARAGMLLAAARTMGDALAERVVRDEDGARWRFVEYRQDPPLLPPGIAWMQAPPGSLPSCSGSPASWTTLGRLRWSTVRTSGGPCRPGSAPCTDKPADAFWHIDDIEATVKAVLDAGGTMQQEINDVGNGRRVAAVIDAEGNVLGFIQDA